MASFLASGVDMDGFIKDVAATIDATIILLSLPAFPDIESEVNKQDLQTLFQMEAPDIWNNSAGRC